MIETLLIPLVLGAAGFYFGWLSGRERGVSEGYGEAMSVWANAIYQAANSDGHVEVKFDVRRTIIEDDE